MCMSGAIITEAYDVCVLGGSALEQVSGQKPEELESISVWVWISFKCLFGVL